MGGANLFALRMLRLGRLYRIVRVLRCAKFFGDMRVLITTIASSWLCLTYATILLFVVVSGTGLCMVHLTQDMVMSNVVNRDDQEWLFLHFGSPSMAAYTMFEATFSGVWANHARRLKRLRPTFVWIWVGYILMVNFAMIRVISAVFLKRTMEVAAADAEKVAMA